MQAWFGIVLGIRTIQPQSSKTELLFRHRPAGPGCPVTSEYSTIELLQKGGAHTQTHMHVQSMFCERKCEQNDYNANTEALTHD